jgi:hypothetical protein
MTRSALLAGVALALALAVSGGAQAANLISDGDFSSPNTGGGWGLFNFPSVGGWMNNNGDALEIGASGIYGLACQSAGCQNLEVDANTFDNDSQTVSGLVVGQTYHLSWDYGGRTSGGPSAMDVSFGGVYLTTNSGSVGVWTHNAYDVVATSTSETLVFQGLNLGGIPSYGNEVTNVSLTGRVPEPATWALMLGGFGLAGAALRKRRALAVA